MQVFVIISVLLFALSLGAKSIIHVILDARNGYKIDYESSMGFVYFFPYRKDVSGGDDRLKRVCNHFQKLSVWFLIIFIVAFLLRFIGRQLCSTLQFKKVTL